MTTATHYENANFLRELAESLPRIRPQGTRPRPSCYSGWPMTSWPRPSTTNGYAPRWPQPAPTSGPA